ncbi:MAG: hypothetical protein HN731_04575 [Rhodospirillaceae bacterium]|jgi:hypothetical protein|nr:hypothetical protein [Rhodospirillaceae bacterium]MBT7954437.1 hypothetical protein [Rhodospirillaceae bacterium]
MTNLSKLFLGTASAVVFLLILNSSADAQKRRSTCPVLQKKIEFTVKTTSRPIDYDVSLNQQQLARLANRFKSSRLKSNERALGLTSSQHSVGFEMNSQVARLGSNRYCARIQSVDVEILVKKLKVYILGKYRRGTCQYKAVVDHEHEHVATFQSGIETLEQTFNDRIWRIIRNLQPGFGSTPKQASQRAFKILGANLNRIKAPIERRMNSRNRQIDTPLSYQMLTQQCSRW